MRENKLYNQHKQGILLMFLVCLFLTVRFAVLFSYLNNLYEPEELYHGTIAYEIIHGPRISLWEYLDYKIEYFPGGSLTAAILAVPFFLLFGPTYISLKLVGLSFALGTFIIWFLFLSRFFSRKAAFICALLFIFCMPFYTKISLVTWGSHPEANFFTILSIYIFYKIFFSSDTENQRDLSAIYKDMAKHFFFLGLVAGFGLWFIQTYLLTILFIFLFWFIFDKGILLRKTFWIFCLGFLVGFSPSLYYALLYKAGIFNVNGRLFIGDFWSVDLGYSLLKMLRFLAETLPKSFLFNNIWLIPGNLLSYLYYLIFLAAFLYLLWRNRKSFLVCFNSLLYPVTLRDTRIFLDSISRDAPLLIWSILFFLGYSLSRYSVSPTPWENPGTWIDYIGYRYMIPLMPFVLVIIGIFIDRVKDKPRLSRIILVVTLGLGIIGNFRMVSWRNFGRFFAVRGYSYNVIADKIAFRGPPNLKEYIRPFENLDEGRKLRFYEGIGSGIAWRLKDKETAQIIQAFESAVDKKYQPYLYRGWGSLFALEIPQEYNKVISVAGNMPLEYRKFFYEGVGRGIGFYSIKAAIELINRIDDAYRPYCYIGLGWRIGFEYKNASQIRQTMLDEIDRKYLEYIYQGLPSGMQRQQER